MKALQGSSRASKMAVRCKRVGRIGVLAFSFVRALITVMDDLVGMMQEDAQALRMRSCARPAHLTCALVRGPWNSGTSAGYPVP